MSFEWKGQIKYLHFIEVMTHVNVSSDTRHEAIHLRRIGLFKELLKKALALAHKMVA